MFENRTEKELIVIYAVIAIVTALGLGVFHYFQGFHPYYIIIAVNIEFFCVFYILYLPIKVKKAREKREEEKNK
jgi:heme O synthase-like polyprenyltransferase